MEEGPEPRHARRIAPEAQGGIVGEQGREQSDREQDDQALEDGRHRWAVPGIKQQDGVRRQGQDQDRIEIKAFTEDMGIDDPGQSDHGHEQSQITGDSYPPEGDPGHG